MKRTRMAAVGLLLAMTCVSHTSFAAGPNLVPNGTFDTDLSGWTGSCSQFGGVCWSSEDAGGARTSGSARLSPNALISTATLASSCTPVTGGDDYIFSVAGKVQFIYTGHADPRAVLLWFNDLECQSSLSGQTGHTIRIFSGPWKRRQRAVTAPTDAAAAHVVLSAQSSGYGFSSLVANFDNIILSPVSSAGTTTTTLACGGNCGDPIADATETAASDATAGIVTSSDALYILQAAVGELTCQLCICDVNDNGGISATDALLTLVAATGGPVSLTCPQ